MCFLHLKKRHKCIVRMTKSLFGEKFASRFAENTENK